MPDFNLIEQYAYILEGYFPFSDYFDERFVLKFSNRNDVSDILLGKCHKGAKQS